MNMTKINFKKGKPYFYLAALSFLIGCSTPVPEPVKVATTNKKIDYIKDVKPILDKRCVTCHSCYNSPCQAKMSSFEGIDRGGSKDLVYDALRLKAADPTRLFIDAQTTQGWRKKGFFSITQDMRDTNTSYNDSIMMHMLYDKKMHPEVIGSYKPEQDKLICPRDEEEMGEYLEDKPNHGMPYGFPALQDGEYTTLSQWLAQGAKGPSQVQQKQLTTPSKAAQKEIQKWEKFLNATDPKHSVTARYLYEHLFLAHIHFASTKDDEFFELVRSYTPAPQDIQTIPTLRPFDDPQVKKFYYRFQKIHSTIVHKTHMVVVFDDKKMQRINELFIQPQWYQQPHKISYEKSFAANPFKAFNQIPVKSRYQFLLDNSHYIVMTFIRGPVCRGQMALNVIHDHFWVMFENPNTDISVLRPDFLTEQAENLAMPIETSTQSVLETFSDEYRERYKRYFKAKEEEIRKQFPQGQDINSIWKGETPDDAPLLTVYRHFDSASVHKGVLGSLPRTLWVIDYPQFERIYYSLVAGYDVFGNISHQTNIRRYMDFLRFEGEFNFASLLPVDKRKQTLQSWYVNSNALKELNSYRFMKEPTMITYKTSDPKAELIEEVVEHHILPSTGIKFDTTNYVRENEKRPAMPKTFRNRHDLEMGAKALAAPGTGFIKHVTGADVNILLIRIKFPDGTSSVSSLVVNRWHDNVDSLFGEEGRLDPSKDSIDFIRGFVGSYPNAFAVIDYKDIPDFFDVVQNFDNSEKYIRKFAKYYIPRSDKRFWETFDWFQKRFNEKEPLRSGLFDLNRYYHN
jgi:hypothetical protein